VATVEDPPSKRETEGEVAEGGIFISYSRQDEEFVRRLHDALTAQGRECWIDWRGIRPTAEWMEEVRGAIEASDAFMYVISPDSVDSEVCREEIEHAGELSKRILPVVYRDVDAERVPAAARAKHWIPCREGDDFEQAARALAQALDTDPDWARLHTRLLVRALEWDSSGRDSSFALRGRDLQAAEEWLTDADERKDPQPTRLHTEYIVASRRAATRGQRLRFAALSVALVVALVLAGFALVQRNDARHQAKVARSRELAATALLGLSTNPERSLLLGVEAGRTSDTPEAADAVREALDATYVEHVLRGHTDSINRASFSPDGKQVITASDDGTARVWDASTNRELRTFRPKDGLVLSAQFSPDASRILTATSRGDIQIWNASTGKQTRSIHAANALIDSARYSPDGSLIVTASDDGRAVVWKAATGRRVAGFALHRYPVYDASFSPDGRLVVSAGADGNTRIWKAKTGREIRVLTPRHGGEASNQTNEVNSALFSPNGRFIVTGSTDGVARVWSVGTGRLLDVLPKSNDDLYATSFSPNGQRIVTASLDGTVRVYDPDISRRRPVLVSLLRGHTAAVLSAAFSPDGRRVVSGGEDRTARIWDAEKDNTVRSFSHPHEVVGGGFSPDGTRIVTAAHDKLARIWDARTGELLRTLGGHQGVLWSAAFSPDGTKIVTANGDHTASIWKASTGQRLMVLKGHRGTVYSAAWSPDARRIATASADGTARVWGASTGEQLTRVGTPRGLFAAAWSPDGRLIVTAGADRTARIWQAGTGIEKAVLRGHTDTVENAAFSPDGQRVITASGDGTARIWNASSGRTLEVLRGHTAAVQDAQFSPNGVRAITGSFDRTIRVWDASSGQLLDILRGFRDRVASVDYAPSGARIMGTSYDDTARIMRCQLCVPFDRLLQIAERRVQRTLSPQERSEYLREAAP
jgi:WD40 repeat protein